ncbi:MAG: NAD-dependent epimerase/dehydratase family protein [Geminicoccaceae bacterium]
MRTLVLTGATGFVGRRLLSEALARGWAVRALVREPSRVPPAEHLEVEPWDALRAETPVDLLAGADAVCHAAAFLPPDYADPAFAERCFRANALGTLSLLAAASEAGVGRFVHFSSGNAYAPGPDLAREHHPLYPSARAPYYLTSKVASEVFVEHWRETKGLCACVLRLGSVYGPGMAAGGLVPGFVRTLRAGRPIVVRDGGRYGVDLVLIDDVVAAALSALETEASGPFNVGSGARTATRELAGLLVEIIGADEELVIVEPPGDGPVDAGFAGLDIGRAIRQLGYRPTPLREGLERYVRWLLSSSPDDLHRKEA